MITFTNRFFLSIGPPKFEYQSDDEVWFQVKTDNKTINKFILRCQASRNPETLVLIKIKINIFGYRKTFFCIFI